MGNNENMIDLINRVNSTLETEKLNKDSHENIFGKTFNIKKYPRITFQVGQNEYEITKLKKLLHNSNTINVEALHAKVNNSTNVYLKLLYSMVWKKGDISKLTSIINGIINEPDGESGTGIVFNSFGKHLRDRSNPIIDQHVIRAFLAINTIENYIDDNKEKLNKELSEIRTKEIDLAKKKANGQSIIQEYTKWLNKLYDANIHIYVNQEDFFYYADQILFTLGKTIKLKNKKSSDHKKWSDE